MNVLITKEQRRVAYAASKTDYRPTLQCVSIKDGKMRAANGFILAEAKIDGNEEMLIPASSILKAKDSKGIGGVIVSKKENNIKIMDANGELTIPQGEGNFPTTEHLYPKDEPVFQIGMSHEVLSALVSVIGKDNLVKLTFYGSKIAAKFEVVDSDIKGIFMPANVEG